MDGHLLVVVADAPAHRSNALCLQTAEEHLLTYAVCLQALAVYIERYLFLLLTEHLNICHGGNTAQAVAQTVAVVLQLTIAALAALYGYEQGRGVAEVVVHHHGQHACGQ